MPFRRHQFNAESVIAISCIYYNESARSLHEAICAVYFHFVTLPFSGHYIYIKGHAPILEIKSLYRGTIWYGLILAAPKWRLLHLPVITMSLLMPQNKRRWDFHFADDISCLSFNTSFHIEAWPWAICIPSADRQASMLKSTPHRRQAKMYHILK